jgi:hypothetical protein
MTKVERTISRDAEEAHANMGMEARQRFMTEKPSLLRTIRQNPKVVFIALFAS